MIERFTRLEMGRIWSPAEKWRRVVRVEVEVLRARVNVGEISGVVVPADLHESLVIDVSEIDRIEREITKHDVMAFLRLTSPQVPVELQPWWHHDLTSYDVIDTALMLCLVESTDLIIKDLERVMITLKARAFEFKNTPMVGRTHLVHAEPITYGVKLANWYEECVRQKTRLKLLRQDVAVGKLSGAVGMYKLSPKIEAAVCEALGLRPVISTQVISRDLIASYVSVLANIAGSIEKFCDTNRFMQQTEVREVEEFFDEDQDGSSAMPHKQNPKNHEQICGLCDDIRGCHDVAMRNQATAHERDLRNSSRERIFLPDSSILMDYVLSRFAVEMGRLKVYPKNTLRNLNLTKGLIYSQDVQSLVAKKSGLPRKDAHHLVKVIALRCWREDLDFRTELEKDELIKSKTTQQEIDECFSLANKPKFVDAIFDRVFGGKEQA